MTTRIFAAIEKSIHTNSIVRVADATRAERDVLVSACYDTVGNGNVEEFWGNDDGNWRVHLVTTPVIGDEVRS